MWPGFGENMRVLKWIFEHVRGGGRSRETPIGWVRRYKDMEWAGLDFFEREVRGVAGVRPQGVA